MIVRKDVMLGTESCGDCLIAAARAGALPKHYSTAIAEIVFGSMATPLSRAGDALVVFRLLCGPERGQRPHTPSTRSARASLTGLPVVPFKTRMLTCRAGCCMLLFTCQSWGHPWHFGLGKPSSTWH
jgi:hypothetical protein